MDFLYYYRSGNSLNLQGKPLEAIAFYRQALKLNPDHPQLHNNLGNVLSGQGKIADAIAHYQHALRLNPSYSKAYNNLGNTLKNQGKIREAIASYRRALELNPSYHKAHSNLLFTLNYQSDGEPRAIFGEHREWGRSWEKKVASTKKKVFAKRKLRIGYVSGDFRTHSVAYFFEPLLITHDRSNFEIFCYNNNQNADETTRRLQRLASHWRNIYALKDCQAIDLISRDEIDILVDLSGHSKGNRLPVFAGKPAPIQISYLGYPNTTGLATIDYRFTDGWADPEGQTEHLHTEKLIRLPRGFLCYQPPFNCPEVAPLPSLKKGYITFGSFNNLAKVSPQLISYWSAILSAVPQSKMIIKSSPLSDRGTQDYVLELFEQHGIARERLKLLGWFHRNKHLGLYNQVDIALDTFPYNGTTTTCEGFWMGTPVITLAGNAHVSRVGVSLLSSIGLKELIAQSPEDYKQKAIALAGDRERLQDLQSGLRDSMKQSPLTDATLITRSLEAAYLKIVNLGD